jgi:hypothetical protein
MDDSIWHLRKASDGTQFGPLPFKQLRQWAADAQVSPLDRVSSDRKIWMKAPMVPELAMDYLIQVGDEQYYGPTTTGAIAEFLAAGEIIPEAIVTNCKDGTEMRVRDLLPPALLKPAPVSDLSISLRSGGIRLNLQQRIRELETALMEERRAREGAEIIIDRLEAKLRQFTDQGEAVSL